MEFKEVKKIFEQQLQQDYEKKSKILTLLNEFGQVIIKNYSPLKYSLDDYFVLFKYANERLRYIVNLMIWKIL